MNIEALIDREGGYVDHPADKGGPTTWGITEAVARASGYGGRMQDLPRDFARAVYQRQYITAPGFDKVAKLAPRVAEEMFDTGVNMGPSVPGPWLQRLLNVLREPIAGAPLYAPLATDGAIGPATLGALATFLKYRAKDGETVFVRGLDCLQGERYIELAETRPANRAFVYGWLLNRVGVP